eukprot:g42068.t1
MNLKRLMKSKLYHYLRAASHLPFKDLGRACYFSKEDDDKPDFEQLKHSPTVEPAYYYNGRGRDGYGDGRNAFKAARMRQQTKTLRSRMHGMVNEDVDVVVGVDDAMTTDAMIKWGGTTWTAPVDDAWACVGMAELEQIQRSVFNPPPEWIDNNFSEPDTDEDFARDYFGVYRFDYDSDADIDSDCDFDYDGDQRGRSDDDEPYQPMLSIGSNDGFDDQRADGGFEEDVSDGKNPDHLDEQPNIARWRLQPPETRLPLCAHIAINGTCAFAACPLLLQDGQTDHEDLVDDRNSDYDDPDGACYAWEP